MIVKASLPLFSLCTFIRCSKMVQHQFWVSQSSFGAGLTSLKNAPCKRVIRLMPFRKAPEMEAFHAGLSGLTLYHGLQNWYLLTEFIRWFQVRPALRTSHLDYDFIKLKHIELSSKPWKTRLRSCSIMGMSIQRALLLVYFQAGSYWDWSLKEFLKLALRLRDLAFSRIKLDLSWKFLKLERNHSSWLYATWINRLFVKCAFNSCFKLDRWKLHYSDYFEGGCMWGKLEVHSLKIPISHRANITSSLFAADNLS